MAKESLVGGIWINAVAPAAVNTELFSTLPLDSQKIAMSRISLGRARTVDEVAALIAWIASEECSFTTGFTFDASGGRDVLGDSPSVASKETHHRRSSGQERLRILRHGSISTQARIGCRVASAL